MAGPDSRWRGSSRASAGGEGFATEGGRAALGHAFTMLGERRAVSLIAPENTASIRVAEKLGMRFEEIRQIEGQTAALYAIERARA